MIKIKVIDWVTWEEAEKYPQNLNSTGILFGTESNLEKIEKIYKAGSPLPEYKHWEISQRWKDYIIQLPEKERPYAKAIREAILGIFKTSEEASKFSGAYHQGNNCGVPLFSDKTVATFGMRGWGSIMAAIWSEKEDKDFTYIDFY